MNTIITVLVFFFLFYQSCYAQSFSIAVSVSPLSAPVIIADELGYFKQQGLNINLKSYIGGNKAATALLENKADFALASEAVVMFKSFSYNNFAIIATFVESNNDVKILTHKQSSIRSINDLSHHRVGTIIGSSSHFFLDHTLLMNGVDPNTVDIVAIMPQHTAQSLNMKSVDAVASWEPYIYMAQQTLGEDALILSHNKMYSETFNLLVKKDFAKNNAFILKKILLALQQAITLINNKPLQAQQIIAKRFKTDIQVIQSTWKDYHFKISLHQSLISTLETEARWALKRGFVKGSQIPNYLNFILLEPLQSISKNSITIIQ